MVRASVVGRQSQLWQKHTKVSCPLQLNVKQHLIIVVAVDSGPCVARESSTFIQRRFGVIAKRVGD